MKFSKQLFMGDHWMYTVSKCFLIIISNLWLGSKFSYIWPNFFVTLPTLCCISESCIKTKVNLNFYIHTPLWCIKIFPFHTSLWYLKEVWKWNFKLIFSLRPGLGQKGLNLLLFHRYPLLLTFETFCFNLR